MKVFLFLFVTFLFSCNTKDPKMCACLEAGEKLNQYSSTIMMKEISKKDVNKMNQLKKDKIQKCISYQNMSGKEMLKLKEKCTEN